MCILVIDLSYQSGSVFILDESQKLLGEIGSPESWNLPIQIHALMSQQEKKFKPLPSQKGLETLPRLHWGLLLRLQYAQFLTSR